MSFWMRLHLIHLIYITFWLYCLFIVNSKVQQADILNLDSDSFDSSPHNSSHTNSATNNIHDSADTGPAWRANQMGHYETEMTKMTHIKKLPDNFYGHNMFHDSSQAWWYSTIVICFIFLICFLPFPMEMSYFCICCYQFLDSVKFLRLRKWYALLLAMI